MGNEYRGTVTGAAAREYAGFMYRRPIPIREVDRLIQDDRMGDPMVANISEQIEDAVDFVVIVDDGGSTSMRAVVIYLLPNAFTAAKQRVQIGSWMVSERSIESGAWKDLAIERAFGLGSVTFNHEIIRAYTQR
jgi:hypothetical protein